MTPFALKPSSATLTVIKLSWSPLCIIDATMNLYKLKVNSHLLHITPVHTASHLCPADAGPLSLWPSSGSFVLFQTYIPT